MNIPVEFSGRVIRTRLNALTGNFEKINQITKEWQGSEIDVIFENNKATVVLVFESQEDTLAFKLKHGDDYV